LVKVVAILGVMNPYTYSYTCTLHFLKKLFFNFVWT